jgi:hypothetical protein
VGNITPEEKQAGIDKLNVLGSINIIDALAQGDVLKYEQVLKLNYNVAFVKLYKNKLESDYRERLKKVLERKTPK